MAKLTSDFSLPKPEKVGGDYVWEPVVRIGRTIPFGYRQDPDDPQILLPIPEELELFEEAKKHLRQYSYRAVAEWLSEESGRSISHVGLYNRLKRERRNKKKATEYEKLAKLAQEAAKKAEALQNRIGGKGTRKPQEDSETLGRGEAGSDQG